ncbi:MAG TPA: serine hydrolase [Xanthobacteraceae bacterium]|nr:serine hydrolase [Xanthobacteraceae bacterium]
MDTEVDHIISRGIAPMVAPNGAGGVAVVAQIGGRNLFFNYGFADQLEKRPITSDSLFNVGSVRKVFEATLVAQAVLRGELKLDEPVAKYVTELHGDYIRQITIGQLVSHTSGLLLPTDHPPWPEQHFSLAGFYDALNAWTPSGGEQPGKQRIYTHAGYILLQLVLERRYGMPIATLIDRGVIAPLGMTSTVVPERGPDNRAIMSPQFLTRAVQGYSLHGEPIGLPGNQQSYFDFPGTGQMFSSAHDLAILLAACLGEAAPLSAGRELREALQLTQREEFRVSAQYGQAMAWEIESPFGVTIVDKPGGLDNASAYIGLVPDRKLGLVILTNRGDVHPFEAARSTILPELARLLPPKPQALGSAARQ